MISCLKFIILGISQFNRSLCMVAMTGQRDFFALRSATALLFYGILSPFIASRFPATTHSHL